MGNGVGPKFREQPKVYGLLNLLLNSAVAPGDEQEPGIRRVSIQAAI